MRRVKKVGIRELKSGLSGYLREVRAGATILVQDRDVCVAEINKPQHDSENAVLQAWATAGEVTLPRKKCSKWGRSPVTVTTLSVQDIVDAERGE